MKLRLSTLTIITIVTLTSCYRTVEVPENNVGVVYKSNQAKEVILETGSHSIGYFEAITLYDTRVQTKDFKFDVLVKDIIPANLDFSIKYTLRSENLVELSKKYQLTYDYNSLDPIVEVETKVQVRQFMTKIDTNQFDKSQLFKMIENDLKTNGPTADIIKIISFTPGQFELTRYN